ncbi:MAG TPA: MarR family transcriptional regulator [Macromonas sp.]|nr:MarR family transcriptional regulator [Macromonas sp.]
MKTNKTASSSAPRASRTRDDDAAVGLVAAVARAEGASDENWDQRLGFLMHDVSRLRRTLFDDFMKPLHVTRSQWWVLAYLSRHDGMIQTDLANVLELGKAALGSLVDRLESAGLVRRGLDEVDRRAKRVYLLPKGAQMIKEMQARSHEMSERILEGLGEQERTQLASLLNKVKDNLIAISKGKK